MPVILDVHGRTYRSRGPIANPRHTGEGYKGVVRTAFLIKKYVRRFRADGSDKLKLLLSCEGYRCEEVLSAVEKAFFPATRDGSSTIPPDVIIGKDWSLGDASSRRSKDGFVHTTGENIFRQEHCFGKAHFLDLICQFLKECHNLELTGKDIAWGVIRQIDLGYPGLKILCAGRNEMECLGELDSFDITSAYLLDWKNKKAECFVRDTTPLF